MAFHRDNCRLWLAVLLPFGMFGGLLTNCGSPHLPPAIAPSLVYVSQLMLTSDDVPSPWINRGEFFPKNVRGADTLTHRFLATSDPNRSQVYLSQELRVYQDAPSAADAYVTETWLPSEHPDKNLGFSYHSQADKYLLDCFSSQESTTGKDLLACTAFQQYGKVLSIVAANIDGELMTIEQMSKVLEHVDARLIPYSAQANTLEAVPGPPTVVAP
jgi:hypothetical protein